MVSEAIPSILPTMNRIAIIVLGTLALALSVSAQTPVNHTYTFTDGPDINPMKGWNSGWWNDYDFASVGFQYLKWKDFEPADSNFNYNAVEGIINRPGTRGRHVVLRLYADWHGDTSVSDAAPEWLFSTYGVQRLQAPNGRYITNYNHPDYISQAVEAIEALANYLDNDPRVYALQLGVLGFWGEWHTFGFNDNNFDIALNTKVQILSAYQNNFSNKHLMGRYPWREPLASDSSIGYHNDFFKPNDNHSAEFDTAVALGAKWLNGPIGGEIPPIDSVDQAQFRIDLYESSQGMEMLELGHYSTMQAGGGILPCPIDSNSLACTGFKEMHRKMGYNFQIVSADFAETVYTSDSLNIDLSLRNIGVAPFYYDWAVQLALLDLNDQPIEIWNVPFNLTSVLPDSSTYTVSAGMPLSNVPRDDYKLGLRLLQPGADLPKPSPWGLNARNTYILFANQIPTVVGDWDSTNALSGAWSILDTVRVDTSSLVSYQRNELPQKVAIFPNPASDQLQLSFHDGLWVDRIVIYDLHGRTLETMPLGKSTKGEKLDITLLPQGVYSLSIGTGKEEIRKLFIKK